MARNYQSCHSCVNLKLDRGLINPNFEGYKLSLDQIPVTEIELDTGIDVVKVSEDQYSYHYAKLYSNYNCLFSDPWDDKSAYFIDKSWNLKRLKIASIGQLESCKPVFTLPDKLQNVQTTGRFGGCLKFPSEKLAVVADGCGHMFLLDTCDRNTDKADWKILFRTNTLESCQPSVLVDAIVCEDDNNETSVHILLVHVEETEADTKSKYYSSFISVLNWITLCKDKEENWVKSRTRQLIGRKPFNYAVLQRNGQGVVIGSENPFRMTYDSARPIVEEEAQEVKVGEQTPEYIWSQNEEEICVQFLRDDSILKKDIHFSLTADHIQFGVKNGRDFLTGDLEGIVDVDSSTWTMSGKIIELFLSKAGRSTWESVVVGDVRGEQIHDASQVEDVYQRLSHLTSNKLNPEPDGMDRPYNAQELEACDEMSGDSAVIQVINGDEHKVTHQVNIESNQWLFNVDHSPSKPSAISLRHDVDGVLWELKDEIKAGEVPFLHFGTFNALGYVQASKQQKRFSTCSPDLSYSVICDCVRHIYIYRQSVDVASPLKNRKTGKSVAAIAKQQVVALESVDNIIGLAVKNDHMFVTTANRMHVVRVNVNL